MVCECDDILCMLLKFQWVVNSYISTTNSGKFKLNFSIHVFSRRFFSTVFIALPMDDLACSVVHRSCVVIEYDLACSVVHRSCVVIEYELACSVVHRSCVVIEYDLACSVVHRSCVVIEYDSISRRQYEVCKSMYC